MEEQHKQTIHASLDGYLSGCDGYDARNGNGIK